LRGLWLALRAWRVGRRELLVISLTTIVYYVAATLASQTTGMSTRMRSPFTILLAILAAEGLTRRPVLSERGLPPGERRAMPV
jgi:hypothetical protein